MITRMIIIYNNNIIPIVRCPKPSLHFKAHPQPNSVTDVSEAMAIRLPEA